MKPSKREIKLALQTHHQSMTNAILLSTTYLKANLEYQQQNFNKSIKLLNSYQKSNEKHVAVLYFNNLGCIHFKMKKYNAASFYYTRALKENEAMLESSGTNDAVFSNIIRSKELVGVFAKQKTSYFV
jgi:CCR4-NOT transcription complex subunit 10